MAKKHNAPAKPALEPNEALFQAVSLCRKAGALTMGFDAVEDAVVKGKAWLVMTASDASPKTCLLYTSPSPRDLSTSRMPSSA